MLEIPARLRRGIPWNFLAIWIAIGLDGSVRPDSRRLKAIHRAHQYAIPFENLDVQLGRPVVLDLEANYNKIVCQRRGGWCYEMNGVMGWALKQIGFEVMRMSAGVMRVRAGDAGLGNHLCLLVYLDERYLVDVGFGGSLAEPLPLKYRNARIARIVSG